MCFVIHGEEEGAPVFAAKLNEELGWNAIVPGYLDTYVLFDGI